MRGSRLMRQVREDWAPRRNFTVIGDQPYRLTRLQTV